MYKVIGVVMVLGLIISNIGCESYRKEFNPTPTEEMNSIRYYRDDRTHLCFVKNIVFANPINNNVYSHVPCTELVEKLLIK